jgi:hypothetical protein
MCPYVHRKLIYTTFPYVTPSVSVSTQAGLTGEKKYTSRQRLGILLLRHATRQGSLARQDRPCRRAMATEVVGEVSDQLSRCQLPVRDRVLAPAVESSDQHVDDDYHQPT